MLINAAYFSHTAEGGKKEGRKEGHFLHIHVHMYIVVKKVQTRTQETRLAMKLTWFPWTNQTHFFCALYLRVDVKIKLGWAKDIGGKAGCKPLLISKVPSETKESRYAQSCFPLHTSRTGTLYMPRSTHHTQSLSTPHRHFAINTQGGHSGHAQRHSLSTQ